MPSTAPEGGARDPGLGATDARRPVIPVAAGCLVRERGEVLIAQRPDGKIAAGKWEFPGGKIERGESPRAALQRELREELGVEVRTARPLIRITHDYADRRLILDTWRVTAWSGLLHGHDNQAFDWVPPDRLPDHDLLAADVPIVNALRLPVDYVFTPPQATVDEIAAGLPRLPRDALLRLRLPSLDDAAYAALAAELQPACARLGLRLVLDRDPVLCARLGAPGWHATSRVLAGLSKLPTPVPAFALASCHSPEELARARSLGFSAAVLGPVRPTQSHPDTPPLGWEAFGRLVREANLPVYAIGGVGPADHAAVFSRYGQGTAGIGAYWGAASS